MVMGCFSVIMAVQKNVVIVIIGMCSLLIISLEAQVQPGDQCKVLYSTAIAENCALYYVCDAGHEGRWVTRMCIYPELFSDVLDTCSDFREVDCGRRSVSFSPCEYMRGCSTNETGSCLCPAYSIYPDLDWGFCRKRKDGSYPDPARRWPPLYVQCENKRTFPRTCDNNTEHISNHSDKICALSVEVMWNHTSQTTHRWDNKLLELPDTSTGSYGPESVETLNVHRKNPLKVLLGSSQNWLPTSRLERKGNMTATHGHEHNGENKASGEATSSREGSREQETKPRDGHNGVTAVNPRKEGGGKPTNKHGHGHGVVTVVSPEKEGGTMRTTETGHGHGVVTVVSPEKVGGTMRTADPGHGHGVVTVVSPEKEGGTMKTVDPGHGHDVVPAVLLGRGGSKISTTNPSIGRRSPVISNIPWKSESGTSTTRTATTNNGRGNAKGETLTPAIRSGNVILSNARITTKSGPKVTKHVSFIGLGKLPLLTPPLTSRASPRLHAEGTTIINTVSTGVIEESYTNTKPTTGAYDGTTVKHTIPGYTARRKSGIADRTTTTSSILTPRRLAKKPEPILEPEPERRTASEDKIGLIVGATAGALVCVFVVTFLMLNINGALGVRK